MGIIIKKMQTDKEIRGKAYVHWRSWQETYPGLMDPDYLKRITREKCEELAFRWPDDNLIAVNDASVVGFVSYGKCRDEDLPDAGEIYAIYVLSEYHGTKTGLRLMEEALSLLKETKVAVWVLKGNGRAIRFYEKAGFRYDGQVKALKSDSSANELRMILDRSPALSEETQKNG